MLLFGNFEHYLFQCIEPNIGHEYRCWFLDISIPHFNNASQVLEIPKGTNTWMKFLLWFFTWISKNHTLSWNSDSWFIKCDWNVKQVGSFGGKDRAKEKKNGNFTKYFILSAMDRWMKDHFIVLIIIWLTLCLYLFLLNLYTLGKVNYFRLYQLTWHMLSACSVSTNASSITILEKIS